MTKLVKYINSTVAVIYIEEGYEGGGVESVVGFRLPVCR